MHSRQRPWQSGAAAIVLIAVSLLSGCSKSGSGSASKSDSASSKSSSKDGKTYTSGSKGGGSKAGSSGSSGNGGSSNAVLPTPADTTNNKASAASDAGYESAIEGQASMTPGAPVYPPSQKQSKPNQH